MTAIELKASLWTDIERVEDVNLLKELVVAFKNILATKQQKSDLSCPINNTAITLDEEGRVVMTQQMKQAYKEGMKQYAEGRCHTMDDSMRSLMPHRGMIGVASHTAMP
ncbi:MAG: hypothetical protein IJP74_03945 [Prevotella sp.]|nr:hypothetical protein [Prevotella sp.]